MGTLRHDFTRPDERFTMLANDWLRDERLSFGALGLLAHLHSHRAGWNVDMESLARRFQTGIRAIRTHRRELEALGYLRLDQPHITGGDFAAFDWTLADPTSTTVALERFTPSAEAASANRPAIEDHVEKTNREDPESPRPPEGSQHDVIEFEHEEPERFSPPATAKQIRLLQRLDNQIADGRGTPPAFDGYTVAGADIAIKEAHAYLSEKRRAHA